MRLSEFIRSNREQIMAEWEAFARTVPGASGMDIAALRDHASEILTVIAEDLDTPQDASEQTAKSKGDAPEEVVSQPTAASEHGSDRAERGFSIEEMVSEYRALRASVIRLWTRGCPIEGTNIEDLTRFNEAIDQALAESVTRYTRDLQESREMFLAILGHDLRTPLGAISMSATFVRDTLELEEPHATLVARIVRSSSRMLQMIGALLDFTRSRLGGGIPLTVGRADLGEVAGSAADELRAVYPDREIEVNTSGDLHGQWDAARMGQVMTNLIGNAIEHGAEDTAVRVAIRPDNGSVKIEVQNNGPAIPADRLSGIFKPMTRTESTPRANMGGSAANLGLGLYIAERIVDAHRGSIKVNSNEQDGTTFTVCLPRSSEPAVRAVGQSPVTLQASPRAPEAVETEA